MMELINTDLESYYEHGLYGLYGYPAQTTPSPSYSGGETAVLGGVDEYGERVLPGGGWQIDEEGRTRDGKIMYYREDCHRDKSRHPSWASVRLKAYYGYDGELPVERCLFGLHLLTESHFKGHTEITAITERPKGRMESTERFPTSHAQPVPKALSVISVISVCDKKSVCVVEAEKTAVIMSEVYPQFVWMAAGGLSALSAEKLRPLRDHKVVLFPDTDPDGTTYACWKAIAKEASRSFLSPVYVSPLLERQATPEQKAAKIDIVDLLFNPKP